MPTFIPTIVNSSPVSITTGLSTLTYEELVNSITSGGYQIKVNELYINASSFSQLSNSWYLSTNSQSGFRHRESSFYQIDVNQFQPTAYWKFNRGEYIIDNLTPLSFKLDANASVGLVFFIEQRTSINALMDNSKKDILELKKDFENKKETITPIIESDFSINKGLLAASILGVSALLILKK